MFDETAAEKILEAVVLGMEPERAALAYGISPEEHARWLEEGSGAQQGDEPSTELVADDGVTEKLVEYVRALDRAVAQAELQALIQVRSGVNLEAHRWFLERRFPDRWAKTPAAARAEQIKTEAEEPDENVVPEDRMTRMRREREERRRAGAADV